MSATSRRPEMPVRARWEWSRPTHLAVVVGGFTVLRVVLWASGLRFRDHLVGQLQLLDEPLLVDNPFRAFTDLHIQPPLWNFLVGAVRAWSPFPDAFSFQVIWFVVALATVLMLWAILMRIGARRWQATTAALLVASSPWFVQNEAVLRYETLAACVVTASVYTFSRFVATPDARRLTAFLAVLVVGVGTRSVLHPLWLFGGVVLAVAVAWRRRVVTRNMAAIAVVPVVLVCAALVIHYARFGTVGFSSYASENLKRVAVTTLPMGDLESLQADGTLSAAAGVKPYSPRAAYDEAAGVCHTRTGNPATGSVVKSTGEPNLNALCYLDVYELSMTDAVAAIRARPRNYLGMLVRNSVIFASWPVPFDTPDVAAYENLERLYRPLLLPLEIEHDAGGHRPQGFVAFIQPGLGELPFLGTVAAALLFAVWRGGAASWRLLRRRGDGRDDVLVWIGFTVVVVATAGIALEFPENARQREALDPILLGPLFVAALSVADRVRRWSVWPRGGIAR